MFALDALPDPLLTVHEAQPMADSRMVARMFGKRHSNVIRAIRNLERSLPELTIEYEPALDLIAQPNGGSRDCLYYRMSETGYLMLAFSFTGKKALAIQRGIIRQFCAMQAELRVVQLTLKLGRA